jgi:signal peptide peptidase SppA
MRGQLLLAELAAQPWALMPDRIALLSQVLTRWASGVVADDATIARVRADADRRDARRAAGRQVGGGVAVLPLYGVLTQRGNLVDEVSGPGSTSTQVFTAALRAAIADSSVAAVVIDCDSPGGSVYGIAELSDAIHVAKAQKPILVSINSLCASAAFWACSNATELFLTPGGEVGSIGVYVVHENIAKALEDEGVEVTLIGAGKYKTEASPFQPLSADARAHLQGRIDDYYSAFSQAVARGRRTSPARVRSGMGQGRVVGADEALSEMMIDGVATLNEVIARAQGASGAPGVRSSGRSTSALAIARLKLAELS